MLGLFDGNVPPWLAPVLIIHLAFFLVLIFPTWRILTRASVRGLYALVHLIPILGWIAVSAIIATLVMQRARRPWPLALLVIVPLANVLFLWLFAFAQWPSVRSTTKTMQKSVKASMPDTDGAEPTLARDVPELKMPEMGALADDDRTVDPVALAVRVDTSSVESSGPAFTASTEIRTEPKPAATAARPLDEPTLFPDKASKGEIEGPTREPVTSPPTPSKEPGVELAVSPIDVRAVVEEPVDDRSPALADKEEPITPSPADTSPPVDAAGATGTSDDAAVPKAANEEIKDEQSDAAKPSAGDNIDLSFIEEDAIALAEGVMSDLDSTPETPSPAGEKPASEKLPGAERTVPAAHEQPTGERIWSIRGISARSANIEVVVYEKDLAHSTTGILIGRSNRADFIINDESVSRNHARFLFHGNSIHVEDLDSMNGTWVDGEKLEANVPEALGHRSEVEFGKIRLEVTQALPKD